MTTATLSDLMAVRRTRYMPASLSPKQRAFLWLQCREALLGGAAGGGKSYALLLGALQYVDFEDYAALLVRRTFRDLSQPGALMNRAHEMLGGTDAHWGEEARTWTFPTGATVTFGHIEHERDIYQYQSAEYQYIGVDELTQFKEKEYTYLFSRLRRREGSEVPLRMRSASNPGNIGHDWVKARFINPETRGDRVFIRSLLTDNPYIDQASYRASLSELDPITRQQYEEGDWDVRTLGDCYFDMEALAQLRTEAVDMPPYRGYVVGRRYAAAIDPAGQGADRHSLSILDCQTGEYVVDYTSLEPVGEFALKAYSVLTNYQSPLLGIEANGVGLAMIEALKGLYYPDSKLVYQDDKRQKVGLVASSQTRDRILVDLAEGVRQGALLPRSKAAVDECFSFVKNDKGRPEAAPGAHDDRVLAMAWANWVAKQVPVSEGRRGEVYDARKLGR